jgi:hypothetical protein
MNPDPRHRGVAETSQGDEVMSETKEVESTVNEAESVAKNGELTDAELEKVSGGHGTLSENLNRIHEKVSQAHHRIFGGF